jgi:hypothetical protein
VDDNTRRIREAQAKQLEDDGQELVATALFQELPVEARLRAINAELERNYQLDNEGGVSRAKVVRTFEERRATVGRDVEDGLRQLALEGQIDGTRYAEQNFSRQHGRAYILFVIY